EAAVAEDWLGKWAMNQMLINVATRKFARSVRLPEGDVPGPAGAGLSKSAASRRFVALSAARMKDWMASDLSGLDLLVIQIDGIHMDEDLFLVAAIGIDAKGDKHPLGLAEGATENAATVQSLIDNVVERGLDPAVPRRRVCRNVKRWRSASMAMRWTAAAMQEAARGFRRLKAHKQLPTLRAALEPQQRLTRRPCSPGHRRLTSISAATASQCSTKRRDILGVALALQEHEQQLLASVRRDVFREPEAQAHPEFARASSLTMKPRRST